MHLRNRVRAPANSLKRYMGKAAPAISDPPGRRTLGRTKSF